MTLAIESSKTLVHYRFSTYELIPLAVVIVFHYALPDYLPLGSAICVTAIFALSLDLVIGYAGIVTLGHSVFFGIGAYTAALLSKQGWGEPISAVITGARCVGLLRLGFGASAAASSRTTPDHGHARCGFRDFGGRKQIELADGRQ